MNVYFRIKIPAFILALLSSGICFGQNLNGSILHKTDSLKLVIDKVGTNVKKATHLITLGKIYEKADQFNTAAENYKKALHIVSPAISPDLFADANINLGNIYQDPSLFNLDSSLYYSEQAFSIYKNLSPPLRLRCLIKLTNINYALYRFEEATLHCLDCIKLAKETSDNKSLRYCYNRMAAFSNLYLNEPSKVKEYSSKALTLALEEGDPGNYSYFYLSHGSHLNGIGEYKNALSYLDSCEKYIPVSYDKKLLADLYTDKGNAYMQLNNYEISEQYFFKAWEAAKDLNLWNRRMHVPLNLAELSFAQQQYQKSIQYAHEVLTVAPDKLTLFELEAANSQLYRSYQAIGNYEKALYHFEKWNIYKDSMNQLNNLGIIAGLDKKYKNKEQEKQIAFQQKTISEHRRQRNTIIGFLIILSLLLAGLFWFFIKIKTSNEKIKASNKKIKEQNQTITEQSIKLKELDKTKSRFYANMSHELRTPLTLMLGPIGSALKRGKLDNYDYTYLTIAQQSGKDLLKLVTSILDLSKLESGKLQLHKSPELLFPFLRRIISAFQSHAEQKGIEFTFDFQIEKELLLMIDCEKVETILNNLLSNAMKFTSRGGKISIKAKDIARSIEFSVTDTGRGIHPDDLPNIFNRFYQSSLPDAPTEGGTGIGLALSQELAKMMGKEIRVESTLGKGSIFYVEIPRVEILSPLGLPPAPSKGSPHPASPKGGGESPFPASATKVESGRTGSSIFSSEPISSKDSSPPPLEGVGGRLEAGSGLLVVEDNHSLRHYLQTILAPHYQVFAAENGQVALDYLNSALKGGENKLLPNLILSDVMMPIMDGYQLLREVKSHEHFRHLPVIMLTARADIKDKLQALRIGVDDYLLKPFVEEELLARIHNLLNNYQQRKKAQIAEPPEAADVPRNVQAEQQLLKKLETRLSKQLANSRYAIPQLADDLSIGERKLRRQIKQLTGLTPTQYFKEIRLQQAREFLEQQKFETIAQTAAAVGFQDAGAFTKNFSKRFGKLPSEYFD